MARGRPTEAVKDPAPLCPRTLRWCAQQLLSVREETLSEVIGKRLERLNAAYAKEWNRLEKLVRDATRRCFYFGTWRGAGHYWRNRHGRYHEAFTETPFQYPDGTYQPDNGQEQGPATLRHVEGWTILAWWDRTEDKRSGCCSALAFEGKVTFEAMVDLLHEHFPRVAARRELTQWHGRTRQESGKDHYEL